MTLLEALKRTNCERIRRIKKPDEVFNIKYGSFHLGEDTEPYPLSLEEIKATDWECCIEKWESVPEPMPG